MKTICDFFALYKRQFLNMVWAIVACSVFGLVLMTIINFTVDDLTAFPVGTLLLIIISFFMIIMYGSMLLQTKFDLLLSMGATRKKILVQYAVFMAFSVCLFWVCTLLNLSLEQFVYLKLMKIPPESDSVYLYMSKICIGIGRLYLIEAGLGVLVAACSLCFGKIVWWVFYLVTLIGMQLPSLLNANAEPTKGFYYRMLLNYMLEETVMDWVICMLAAVILSFLGWLILRKQRVTL